ncbi:tripartite tricarboxylate transporter substrate binding protein [Ensifer sp. YR511]|uniref:tripartite tricarboxylate transporter substrate binding protein n=1 Tax=Ensifer sp. YR511 TaxID=1855294 RepID=UPI000883B04C|nr:tripartite tricarboxylate transporter substrate binding protein [Ensifer sp. YR511]SDN43510.1 Tripartite-type tricarboxylate transporter, receptor component TctC [Ensifer sp. YR511]
MKLRTLTASIALSVSIGIPAWAEFPEKPIELIVPFGPGGGTDVAARSIAIFMEKHLGDGTSIAVINTPGAGGVIGWTKLANAKPDGYTIGMVTPPNFVAQTIAGNAKYELGDFQLIGNIVLDPGVLVVRKDSPYQTLADIVNASRAAEGKVVIGTSGAAGSSEHIGLLNFNRIAETTFTPAFFGDTAALRQAILGGHIPAGTPNLSEVVQLIRSGDLRLLGVMASERSAYLPDAPTFAEQGFDLVVTASRGLAAPAGVPTDVIEKLEGAMQAAMQDPAYRETAAKAEIPLSFLDAGQYGELLKKMESDLVATWKVTPWR